MAETTAETVVEGEESYEEITTFESEAVEGEYTSESLASRFGDPQPAAGTGRRKQSIARVRIVPGSGKWKINGRTLEGYFPNKVHQQEVNEPFKVLELDGRYDVVARISRRRHLRPGRCAAPGRRPRAQRGGRGQQPRPAEEGRLPDP